MIKTYKESAKELFTEPRKSQFFQITKPAVQALEEAPNDSVRGQVEESLQKELIDFFAGDQKMRYISCKVVQCFPKKKKPYYDYELQLSIDWAAQWEKYAVKLETFQYQNVILIDYEPFRWH